VNYNFDIAIAQELGVSAAIVVQNLQFWIKMISISTMAVIGHLIVSRLGKIYFHSGRIDRYGRFWTI
jgi:hypothetical protein